jgi:aldehyde dehydrogenase (NAD+)
MTTTQASAPAQLPNFSLVIDGQLAEQAYVRRYESIDPFSGAPWATAADGGEADVNLAVAAARRALSGPWGQLTVRLGPAHAAAGRAHRRTLTPG